MPASFFVSVDLTQTAAVIAVVGKPVRDFRMIRSFVVSSCTAGFLSLFNALARFSTTSPA